jgi:hypothetical protein
MTHHTDGLDSIGARAGDTVRCTGMRDRGGCAASSRARHTPLLPPQTENPAFEAG